MVSAVENYNVRGRGLRIGTKLRNRREGDRSEQRVREIGKVRPRRNTFEERAAALKARLHGDDETVIGIGDEPTYNLKKAAARIGVSYSTARRLLNADPEVQRYSGTTGQQAFFPGMALKRHQRVRLTWIIPESSIQRVILKMRGQRLDAA
jgi:hypothetical protein